jgi:penicillin amidase
MTRTMPSGPLAQEAIRRLERWDFRMDRQKVAPLLFVAWLREFSRAVLFGRFGNVVRDYWDLRPQVMESILRDHRGWCKNRGHAGCRVLLAATLDAALEKLKAGYGADMASWRWGRAHVAQFPNPVFDRIPVLGPLLRVAIPTAGGYDTLNRGPSTIRDPRHPFEQRFGAGLRIITDLAAPRDSRMMIVPGQSGNPLSRHFDDLLRPWRDFDWLRPDHAAARPTLTLSPQQSEKRP